MKKLIAAIGVILLVVVVVDTRNVIGDSLLDPIGVVSCVPPPAGLISWWSGDENADDRMNNNPGTAENGTTYGEGKVRQAFSFDGEDDYVNVPDSLTLDAITTEITVDFWIRPQQPYETGWIFARRDPFISEGFSVAIGPSGELMINLRTDTSTTISGTIYLAAPIIQFEEWQHVAVTANTQLGQVDAYVNGNSVSLEHTFGPHPVSGQLFNVNNLFIGRRQSSDTSEGPIGGAHYAGEVDEVEIFARALSQAEIQAIYNAGTAGKCDIQVGIDIKPDNFPNNIVLGSHGTVPVAILSAPDVFDATDVDPATVRLAGAGGALRGNGTVMASVQDVNGDGWMDLVVHVSTEALQLAESDTLAVLTGKTFSEVYFWGTDWVRIVGSAPPPSCIQPLAGLTGWWPGDGNTDDIIGGRSAVLHEDATTGAGLIDGAFVLDGDEDFVDVPHDPADPAFNVGTGDFTVAVWVFFNDTAGEQVLVEKWIQRFPEEPDDLGTEGWTLTKLEDNVLRLAMAAGFAEEIDVDSDVLPIAALTWNHFAATRQGSQVTLFMNGMPVADGESPLNLNSTSSLKFGHRGNPDDTPGSQDESGFYLNGRIDEVQIFVGRALPPAQIRAIFGAGRAGMCK